MIIREPAAAYHARKALSAGMAWDIVSECPAYAWPRSVFNPERVERNSLEFDIGSAAHLLTLEHNEFAERTFLVPFDSYRSKEARAMRDSARDQGLTPLRLQDALLVCDIHDALKRSSAAELLFGEGENEVSYTWDFEVPRCTRNPRCMSEHGPLVGCNKCKPSGTTDYNIACKARADRISGGHIIDLKTAASASPQAFQRAMVRDGHHLRAAWYLDGWGEVTSDALDSLFVVVSKEPPHLVSVFRLDERSIEWGRMLYRKALAEFRVGMETGGWIDYAGHQVGSRIITSGLPAFAEHRLAEMEAEGEL